MAKTGKDETVQVVIRCRPLQSKEETDGRKKVVDMNTDRGEVFLKNPKNTSEDPRKFTFDKVFDDESSQEQIFNDTAKAIVDSCFEGYNGTIFAYGQTGTGKTFTMEGKDEPEEMHGIIPRTFHYIFDRIENSKDEEFVVYTSFMELYNEEVRDLLAKSHDKKLELKEDPSKGPYVRDLTSVVVKSVKDFNSVLAKGKKNRSVGATLMNQDSSRSHSVFSIAMEVNEGHGDQARLHVGKLNLVDLAGSERQQKTGATGERLKESTKINLSLSALGNVISSLVDGKTQHIPYRDSKLTRLLQDSLGGNTKTVMIANLGPADWNYDETLSTLRYANRAKNIKNKPRINEDPKDAKLRAFQDEIRRLKMQLAEEGDVDDLGEEEQPDEEEIQAIREQVKREMEEEMKSADPSNPEVFHELNERAVNMTKERFQEMMKEKSEGEAEKMEGAMNKQSKEVEQWMKKLKEKHERKRELEKQLKRMQSWVHNVDLLQLTQQNESQLRDYEQRVEEHKKRREQHQQQLERLEGEKSENMKLRKQRKEEASQLAEEGKRLKEQYQDKRQEIEDTKMAYQEEREDLLDSMRELERRRSLYDLIIRHFVPDRDVSRVRENAYFDESANTWRLDGVSSIGDFERPPNLQCRRNADSNILRLELDMPSPATCEFDGLPKQHVQTAIQTALSDDSSFCLPRPTSSRARSASARPVSASGSRRNNGPQKSAR